MDAALDQRNFVTHLALKIAGEHRAPDDAMGYEAEALLGVLLQERQDHLIAPFIDGCPDKPLSPHLLQQGLHFNLQGYAGEISLRTAPGCPGGFRDIMEYTKKEIDVIDMKPDTATLE